MQSACPLTCSRSHPLSLDMSAVGSPANEWPCRGGEFDFYSCLGYLKHSGEHPPTCQMLARTVSGARREQLAGHSCAGSPPNQRERSWLAVMRALVVTGRFRYGGAAAGHSRGSSHSSAPRNQSREAVQLQQSLEYASLAHSRRSLVKARAWRAVSTPISLPLAARLAPNPLSPRRIARAERR